MTTIEHRSPPSSNRTSFFHIRARTLLWTVVAVGAVCAVAGIGLLTWYATAPGATAFAGGTPVELSAFDGHVTGVPSDFKGADPIAKGGYLTAAADCQACHTAEGGKPFAGGRPFKTPFGTLYSPNITPDAETGIGKWTDAEFLRAVHDGVGRGDKKLYPAFPYASYTNMVDADVLAIKGFLFTLAPVHQAAPANELLFPFNQRFLMSIWGLLFNPDKRFSPIAERSEQWNRGAYLVEAMAHCGECHTPRNLMEAVDNRHKFAGAVSDGWNAYNITTDPASGIGAWSLPELTTYLATGHASGRGTASGPMAEAVALSFTQLTPSDITAMAVYLRSIPSIGSSDLPLPKQEVAAIRPEEKLPSKENERGQRIFAGACVACHDWTGVSRLTDGATLLGSRAVNDLSGINVAQMIMRGSGPHKRAGELAMPAFGYAYSDDEIAVLANYVTGRFGTEASRLSADDVRNMR